MCNPVPTHGETHKPVDKQPQSVFFGLNKLGI